MSLKHFSALLLLTALVGCASGTVLVTGHKRPAISADAVMLYTTAPAHYEVIGLVNAEASHGWTNQGRLDKAVAELKEQAAAIGANGILVGGVATGSGGSVGMAVPAGAGAVFVTSDSHDQQVSGTAIYVQPDAEGH